MPDKKVISKVLKIAFHEGTWWLFALYHGDRATGPNPEAV
jgi:hypothetical protein